jgi:hypothetical protein
MAAGDHPVIPMRDGQDVHLHIAPTKGGTATIALRSAEGVVGSPSSFTDEQSFDWKMAKASGPYSLELQVSSAPLSSFGIHFTVSVDGNVVGDWFPNGYRLPWQPELFWDAVITFVFN